LLVAGSGEHCASRGDPSHQRTAGRSINLVFLTCLEAFVCPGVMLPFGDTLRSSGVPPTECRDCHASRGVLLLGVFRAGGLPSPAPAGSVDCWPLVTLQSYDPGGFAGVGADLRAVPRLWFPSWSPYVTAWTRRPLGVSRGSVADRALGISAGALWMTCEGLPGRLGWPHTVGCYRAPSSIYFLPPVWGRRGFFMAPWSWGPLRRVVSG
jgi:hypothetical protein